MKNYPYRITKNKDGTRFRVETQPYNESDHWEPVGGTTFPTLEEAREWRDHLIALNPREEWTEVE